MRKLTLALILSLCLIALPRTDAQVSTPDRAARGLDSTTASHGPKMILIIRHGEKPGEESKKDKDPNLSPRGYERAKALAHVIPDNFVKPDFLFATAKSAHSNRPMETIAPLAKSLDEKIEDDFKDDDYAALAHKILTDPQYDGKIVLIAWHHGKIPDLAHSLGATDAPDKWKDSVFDRVWEITYGDGKAAFSDLPQKALPGDSEK